MSAIKIVHDDRLFLIDGPISDLLEYYEELKAAATCLIALKVLQS